jgi:hypothetical protein
MIPPATPTPPWPVQRLAPRVAAALVLALAVALRLVHFAVPERSPDEELYTRFGAGIAREGLAWQTRIVHDFNRDADVDFPWPWRIGFTGLVGVAMRASGDTTVRVGEALSTGASVLSVAATGMIAWSALGTWPAVAAMSFLAVSPLDLALARRAWQDDVVMLITLAMLLAFLRAARGGRLAHVTFFALAAWGLTVKESLGIPAGVGTLGLAWCAWRRSGRAREALVVLVAGALAALAAAGAIVAVCGGWSELHTTLELAKVANAPDDYLRHYQTGGVLDYYGRGLAILQPLPWLLAYVFAAWAIVAPRGLPTRSPDGEGRRTLRVVALHLATFSAVAFSYASKNLRFLSPVYPAVAILAAGALAGAVRAARARGGTRAAWIAAATLACIVLASGVRDLAVFQHYFVEDEVQDLATPWFTQVDTQDRLERAREPAVSP